MHTIELTEEELRLVRNALQSFLEDFGHDQADLLRSIKPILAKLPRPGIGFERVPLFRRKKDTKLHQIGEAEAYGRSYGDTVETSGSSRPSRGGRATS